MAVTLYRGQPWDPNVPLGQDNWTSDLTEAQSHARASNGMVFSTQVPEDVAAQANALAKQYGDFGRSGSVHHIPGQYADLGAPHGVENVLSPIGQTGGLQRGFDAARGRTSLVEQIVDRNLPGVQRYAMNSTPGMDPELIDHWTHQMQSLRQQYPKTVEGFRMFERANPDALSHYREIGGATNGEFAMGYQPWKTLDDYENAVNYGNYVGFNAIPGGPETPVQSIATHEIGHAVDNSMLRHLRDVADTADPATTRALTRYTDLKSQLVADALNGNVSKYAQQSAAGRLDGMLPGTSSIDALRSQGFGTKDLLRAGNEPFAESFVKNPALLDELRPAMEATGWRGAVSPGVLGGGVGLGAALLAAPIIANKVGGRWGNAINGAATGAGLGGMLGPEGALAGAGIGALASQIL